MTLDIWNRLPTLKRSDVRNLKDELIAPSYPEFFGKSAIAYSGGSTGIPVGVKKSEMDSLIWESCHIRELKYRPFPRFCFSFYNSQCTHALHG